MEKLTVQQKGTETLLCAAVGTAGRKHGLATCNVYGDPTVCNCRHGR
jgi:hypothetical protein